MNDESQQKTLIILNDPPYGSERSYNGLRLAGVLARNEFTEVKVFLMGDAVACARTGQDTPRGYYNVERMGRLPGSSGGGRRGHQAADPVVGGRTVAARTIVILGGGVGGLACANELRRRLSREYRIVLVERNGQHAFAPSFLWLMTGDRQPGQITRPVRELVRAGVDILQGEAHGIDLAARHVESSGGTLTYDYLVVALGAELAPDT